MDKNGELIYLIAPEICLQKFSGGVLLISSPVSLDVGIPVLLYQFLEEFLKLVYIKHRDSTDFKRMNWNSHDLKINTPLPGIC